MNNLDENIPETEQVRTDDEITLEPLDDEGEGLSDRDIIKKLRERLKTAIAEKQENLLGWQRMKADYANLMKSFSSERAEFESRSKSLFVRDILPVLDSFDQAMSNELAWNKVDSSWRLGIEYIRNQLLEALMNNGISTFGAVGDKFDPLLHQTIEHNSETKQGGEEVIKKVLERGIKFKDTIIRPAKVVTTN